MIITSKITMDLQNHNQIPVIHAVQSDSYSRNLEITLTNNGVPFPVPGNASVIIRYQKVDGKGGEYDTLPDGAPAWTADQNILSIALAPQTLTAAGNVVLAVTLIDGTQHLSTFQIHMNVHPLPQAQIGESDHYHYVTEFLTAPPTAEAGQYLQVASVDGHGKVTALQAVNLSAGTEVDISGVVKSVNGITPDEKGNVNISIPDSSENGNTMSLTLRTAIYNLLMDAVYQSGHEADKAALEELLKDSSEEPEDPVVPDEPDAEKTLTGISAAYSGGSVPVGTAVSALTGIVVTAHYSDGTSETVTGYTLAGSISEGSNTITVSYGGKTTTFTVTGVAESGGEEASDTIYPLENGSTTFSNGASVEIAGNHVKLKGSIGGQNSFTAYVNLSDVAANTDDIASAYNVDTGAAYQMASGKTYQLTISGFTQGTANYYKKLAIRGNNGADIWSTEKFNGDKAFTITPEADAVATCIYFGGGLLSGTLEFDMVFAEVTA